MDVWQIPRKAKFKDIPVDAQPAFLRSDGTPYKSWKEIEAGNWQPQVAFLEGRFYRVRWEGADGWDAVREEMPPGSYLLTNTQGSVILKTQEEFER